jgi:hypothetical protein
MTTVKKDPEVEAMGKLAEALDGLEPEQHARVLRWAADRYSVALNLNSRQQSGGTLLGNSGGGGGALPSEFDEVGDLVAAAEPSTDEDRALVVAYWLQEMGEKLPTFNGQQVNRELKNLGHGTDDITDLIGKLVATSPQLVLQTKKSGTSRQARKSYKVTKAGIKRVQDMVANAG